MAEELKACRYRVEKTGYGFWPFCVRAGDGTRELFKGHQKQCMVVAAELETAFEDGKFVADRAQASQGGEAVEVVAWQDAENPLHTTASRRVMHEWADNGYPIAELMTVSQHQRILAAATHPADQVAEGVVVSRELLERTTGALLSGPILDGVTLKTIMHQQDKLREEIRALLAKP